MSKRDLVGYGGRPPHPRWPGEARVAVQFVLNIEEGAELSILNGDERSENYLHELPGRPSRTEERDLSVEGMNEYGSRAGVWRILELFSARDLHSPPSLSAGHWNSTPRSAVRSALLGMRSPDMAIVG